MSLPVVPRFSPRPVRVASLGVFGSGLGVVSRTAFGPGPWWSFQFCGPFALPLALRFALVAFLLRFRVRVGRWGPGWGWGLCVSVFC